MTNASNIVLWNNIAWEFFQNNWCSTKKPWVTSGRMKLPSRLLDEKIPRNVGNCRKCLVVNATSHANHLGLEARHFPLCFVTAPLWGARPVPPNQQLCNRPPQRGQDDSQSRFLARLHAFFVKEMPLSGVRLTFFLLLVYPWPSLNYRLSSPEGRIRDQVTVSSLSRSHLPLPSRPAWRGRSKRTVELNGNTNCIQSWWYSIITLFYTKWNNSFGKLQKSEKTFRAAT